MADEATIEATATAPATASEESSADVQSADAPVAAVESAASPEESGAEESGPRSWQEIWQAPTLLLAIFLVVAGLVTARVSAPGPDFDGALDDIEALLNVREYQSALDQLNDVILPHLSEPEVTTAHRRRFHLLRGDAVHRLQGAKGISVPENHRLVLEEYDAAQRLLAQLDPVRRAVYAETLVALGRFDEALAWIRQLPVEEADRKRALIRSIVEKNLRLPEPPYELTLSLLSELAMDDSLNPHERIWVVAKQAELRIGAGYVEEGLGHLLRSMQRLENTDSEEAGELYLLLAQCYFELGRFADAQRQIARAIQLLPSSDALVGRAHQLSGQIHQINGHLQDARDKYTIVVSDFPGTRASLPAWLGLAEVEAAQGTVDASLESYSQAVDLVTRESDRVDVTRDSVTASLLNQRQERFIREDYKNALRYAQLAIRAHTDGPPPPSVILAMAQTHRAIGDQALENARDGERGPLDLSKVDPVTRAEARAHYAEAGDQFLRHARAVLLLDDELVAESLWNAADSFDLAGDYGKAIEAFSEYASGRLEDPRQPQALYRLARAHMARQDYSVALQFLEDLIAQNPSSGEGTASYVPLAQCYLLDDDPSNDSQAEAHLATVISGRLLSPEALEFRDALIELGLLYLDQDRLEEAIESLQEAIERYPDDTRIDQLRFSLAEANRRSAAEIEVTLQEAMPERERRRFTQLRNERLQEAVDLFDLVRRSLDRKDPRKLTSAQRVYLRNALFYRADGAFDLGDYDTAIKHYDAVAQRYPDDPASLVAMIQIVNAYVEKGAIPEAKTAQERARQRLMTLPDSAFANDELPMDRRYWERWLDSKDLIREMEEGTS